MARVLFIIPPERFRDEELFVTKKVLERNGHTVTLASTKKGNCSGSRGGYACSVNTLDEISPKNYSAVVFVGGGGSKLLWRNEIAHEIAREMNKKGKVVAAICLAPVTLAYAGVLKNRKATVAGTEAKTLEMMGARYTEPGVTVDGNVVTGNAPKASKLFGEQISKLIMNSGSK